MNEEVKVEDKETHVEETEIETEPQLSEVELEAIEQGWVPKEAWVEAGRDPGDWRPAKEFKERGELFKTIHQTKRDLKQTQAALQALQSHHAYVFEKAQKQAIEELKREKKAALRAGDLEAVEVIEERIESQEDANKQEAARLAQAQAVAQQNQVHPEFQAWVDKNQWYSSDPELADEAEAMGIVYFKRNQDKRPIEVLTYVEKKIKEKYPEKFGIKKAAPNAVAGVNRTTQTKKTETFSLTQEEQEVMNTLVRQGVMTKEQYIAELKKVS